MYKSLGPADIGRCFSRLGVSWLQDVPMAILYAITREGAASAVFSVPYSDACQFRLEALATADFQLNPCWRYSAANAILLRHNRSVLFGGKLWELTAEFCL